MGKIVQIQHKIPFPALINKTIQQNSEVMVELRIELRLTVPFDKR